MSAVQDWQRDSGQACVVLDASGKVVQVTATGPAARFVDDLGEGHVLAHRVHPEDRPFFALTSAWIAEADTRPATIRLRWARDGGRWSTLFATLERLGDDATLVTLRDDDAPAARRAEAQLRRVVEGSAQGIVVRNNDRVLYLNDAFARLLGFASSRELSAHSARQPADVNMNIHPGDIEMVKERVRARLAGEETVSKYDFRLVRRDGSIVWVNTFVTLAEWDGQRCSLSWMSDIGERKRMEEQLRRTTEAAEFANRTKTEFLANMSHELRTPLNAILGFSEVIRDELFGPAGGKYAEYARDIHRSGTHLLEIINDILDLSKLEAGKLDLHESDVAVPAVVEECLTLVRNKAGEGGIVLVNAVPADLPLLRADTRGFKQVILNFLSNAVKFTPEGGEVRVDACAGDEGLTLSVSDTGIGMTPEQIKIAMSPFGQINSKLARKHEGTGLGLPICRSLMELHGGSLEVTSAPNRGTTMTATFPATRIAGARKTA